MRFAALLALALLLSGCAADDPSTDSADDGRASESGEPTAVPTVPVAVAFSGDIGPAFCVRGLPAQAGCVNSSPATPPATELARTYLHDAYTGPLAAELQVAWDALTPATAELRVQWGVFTDCETRCVLARIAGDVTQASPVDVSVSSLVLEDGERFGVYVHSSTEAGGLDVEASATQAFTVSGQVLVVEG